MVCRALSVRQQAVQSDALNVDKDSLSTSVHLMYTSSTISPGVHTVHPVAMETPMDRTSLTDAQLKTLYEEKGLSQGEIAFVDPMFKGLG